jgi:[glutamine synthetase] adenylyltransferase / [glutamine synthetase]-adenylyl-L-tyrosine phosphorylase
MGMVGEHPRGSSPQARLARLGFTDTARVAATLDRLALALPGPVVAALAGAADPDLALASLDRIVEAAPAAEARALHVTLTTRPGARGRLVAVLGASAALGEHLVRHPADWRIIADDASVDPPGRRALADRLLAAVGALPAAAQPLAAGAGADVLDALRLAYRRCLLAIAARDLTGAVTLDAATAELADLAAAALDAGLAIARAGLAAPGGVRLAIIGMGKCGGRELNYVSDVDVVFVAAPGPGEPAEPAALRQAARLAEGVLRACGSVTPGGALFPVDTGLRPEGRAGPLVRTLASYQAYYARWARTWEYQALLKARPVAGDLELGRAFCSAVAPLVWSAASRDGFVADVQAMRRRVEASLTPGMAGRDLKLGPGGLRDVEFAVQLLQLVHGRTDPTLRAPATLPALAALATGGYVGRADAAGLAASYRFLRAAEHRLQLAWLRRTHTLPVDPAALRWLGRSLGIADAEEFTAEHARTARTVRHLHEKLFYRPLLEAVARLPAPDARLSPGAAATRLEALGFRDTGAALRHLGTLSAGVSRTAAIQRQLLPAMLGWFADAADPDAGLLAYRRVSEALGRTPWYLRMLRDSGGSAERLARVLASSAFVAGLMAREPESVRLLRTEDDLRPRGSERLAATMLAVAARNRVAEGAATGARAVRRVELVRIACADLCGLLDGDGVARALSDAAVATIAAHLAIAWREVTEAAGGALPVRLAVIALGRLGGAELSYGSDADVLFVHEPVPGAGEREATAAALDVLGALRRLLSLPAADQPLLVDAGLRPEGRTGPLTRTLPSYLTYYRRWSLGWEAQALLRASAIAGDADLGRRFVERIDEVRYPTALKPGAVDEVARLKRRMEAERIPRGVDRTLHVKLGPGGLTDVEWALQLLQLRHAHAVAGLRTPSTPAGLRAAAGAGLLAPAEAATLAAAWSSAARIRNGIMLASGRRGDVIPTGGRALARLAAIVGPAGRDAGELPADHRRAAAVARGIVDDIFARERTS